MGTAIVEKLPRENRFVRFCDFCGSSEREAFALIASPNGNHICDECVDVCALVIEDRRLTAAKEDRG